MVSKSESIKELAAALAKAQGEMKSAIKSRTVRVVMKDNKGSYTFDYATLDDVWDAIRLPLTNNGLSIAQPIAVDAGKLTIETTLLHGSGEFLSSTATHSLGSVDLQGMGTAITYLRRYTLCAMVGVTSDEDDDGNNDAGNHRELTQRRPLANAPANGKGSNYQKPAKREPQERHSKPGSEMATGLAEASAVAQSLGQIVHKLQTETQCDEFGAGLETSLAEHSITDVQFKGLQKTLAARRNLLESEAAVQA